MDSNYGGSQLVVADAILGVSGQPVRIYSIHILSTSTAAVVSLRNGSTVGGTIWITETGTISTGKTISFGTSGAFFPNGCFVDVDANTTSVLVNYIQS